MTNRTATHLITEFKLILAPDVGPEDVHAHGKQVMEELLNLEECSDDFTDSTVSTDTNANAIAVELVVLDRPDVPEALQRALDVIRAAVHAAGGATPNWPVVVSERPAHVEIDETPNLVSA